MNLSKGKEGVISHVGTWSTSDGNYLELERWVFSGAGFYNFGVLGGNVVVVVDDSEKGERPRYKNNNRS